MPYPNRSVTKLPRKVLGEFLQPSKCWESRSLQYDIEEMITLIKRASKGNIDREMLEYYFPSVSLELLLRITGNEAQCAYLLQLLEQRLAWLLANEPADEYESWTKKYDHDAVRRIAKAKRRRNRKEKNLRTTPECGDVHDEPEFELPERNRHRKGWKTDWLPTRLRYWRPVDNNWKQHCKVKKQWMRHL